MKIPKLEIKYQNRWYKAYEVDWVYNLVYIDKSHWEAVSFEEIEAYEFAEDSECSK